MKKSRSNLVKGTFYGFRFLDSKYRNESARCFSRHAHQSKAEASYCNRLLAMKQAGEIFDYKIQVAFEVATGIIHVVDFVVWPKAESILHIKPEVHEVKGFQTDVWKIKRKLFQALYPDIPYKVITTKGELYGRKKRSFDIRSRGA